MAEEYAERMARKTDAELQQYVTGRAQYRDDAVLAALDELARRGQSPPDAAQVRPELEVALREQKAREAEASRQAEREAVAEAVAEKEGAGPALYSPGTITLFSVLFSMLAGGALLGINLKVLRRTGALVRLMVFIVLYLIVGAIVLNQLVQRYGMNPWFGAFFDLPAILAYNLWFWPRYIRTSTFQSRGWLLPFGICALVKIGLYVVAAQFLARYMSAAMH